MALGSPRLGISWPWLTASEKNLLEILAGVTPLRLTPQGPVLHGQQLRTGPWVTWWLGYPCKDLIAEAGGYQAQRGGCLSQRWGALGLEIVPVPKDGVRSRAGGMPGPQEGGARSRCGGVPGLRGRCQGQGRNFSAQRGLPSPEGVSGPGRAIRDQNGCARPRGGCQGPRSGGRAEGESARTKGVPGMGAGTRGVVPGLKGGVWPRDAAG